MMNVSTILERIERDAKDAANELLAKAKERALAIEAESDQFIEQARKDTLEQARAQSIGLSKRLRGIADLDARKETLREKRLLLDEAFSLALDKMNAMPEKEARAHGLKVLLKNASGMEAVIACAGTPGATRRLCTMPTPH